MQHRGNSLCFVLIEEDHWVAPLQISELEMHLINNTEFYINFERIDADRLEWAWGGNAYEVWDEHGNRLGSYGGWLEGCVNTDDIRSPLLLAIIITQNPRGEEYAFLGVGWNF